MIGLLRDQIQIQSYEEVPDATHGTIKTYTTIDTVWANIEPVKGLVTLDTKQIGEGITHKITIRYTDYITTENWIIFKSRRFRIRSVINLQERSRFYELLCEEVFYAINEFEVESNAADDPLTSLFP